MAGTPGHVCRRGKACAEDYQSRVSGPFLDRIDLRIEVAAVTAADLILPPPAEGSAEVAARVAEAPARSVPPSQYFDALRQPVSLSP